MKKYLLIIWLLASVHMGYAQVSGGIRGGVNFSKLESEFLTTDSEIGYYGGLFATWETSELVAIQPEVYFAHQAGETNGLSYSFDYLAVPLLMRLKFSPIHVYAGAHLGFLLAVDATGVEKDDFKGTALSGVLGAGYELAPVEIGGRYVHGFTDISDNELLQDVHFRMWEIYVAWRLFNRSRD